MGGVEVRRVRFAPARVEARVALGESYRVFSGLSALWVIPMIAQLTLTAARQARCRPSAAANDSARRVSPANNAPVIHGHWWFPCGLVAVVAAMAAGSPVGSVVQIHGSDAAVTTNAAHRWLARRVLRRAGAVVTVSEDLRDWAASLLPRRGGLRSPLSSEPEGQRSGPLLRIVSMPVGAERLGTPTPAPPEGPVVAVGRLMAEKGFDVLIEALAHLPPAERPEAVIVGDGPDRTLLAALAMRRGVTVQFAGAVAPAEIGEWYRRARLVCVPSRREGFGMVVAEALAAGRAVVATKVGAAPQFIVDGTNGYLVRPDDASALAEALATALQSDLGAGASSSPAALAPFGPQAHAAALHEIYASVAATTSEDSGGQAQMS